MPRRKQVVNEPVASGNLGLADAILRVIDDGEEEDVLGAPTDFIDPHCLALQLALNLPGIPVGRLTVLRGWEQSGKSTLAMHLLIETQQRGGIAVYLDTENAYDEYRAKKMGLVTEGPDRVIVRQPQTVEECITFIERFIKAAREAAPDCLLTIILDSMAGTAVGAEMEGEIGESKAPGQHSKLLKKAFRRITKTIAHEQVALIIVNQNTEKIEMNAFSSMRGPSSSMLGDHPLSFHASVVIDMSKSSELTKGEGEDKKAYGVMVRVKVSKNKCSHPFGRAQARIIFDTGFDDDYAHFQAALKLGMIVKKGTSRYRMADAEDSFVEGSFGKILSATPGLREKIRDAARLEFWPQAAKDKYLSGEDAAREPAGAATSADD